MITWYQRYQQILVPRPGTLTLIKRGSLKRKSRVQISDFESSLDEPDLTSRSLKVLGPWAWAMVNCSTVAPSMTPKMMEKPNRVLPPVMTFSSPRELRRPLPRRPAPDITIEQSGIGVKAKPNGA